MAFRGKPSRKEEKEERGFTTRLKNHMKTENEPTVSEELQEMAPKEKGRRPVANSKDKVSKSKKKRLSSERKKKVQNWKTN